MNGFEDIANNALENPTPYKWAMELSAATAFGAAYRTSKKLAGKDEEISYGSELTSLGGGALSETADQIRDIAGKSQIFDYSDLALITGGLYTGQKIVDEKIEDSSEFGEIEY